MKKKYKNPIIKVVSILFSAILLVLGGCNKNENPLEFNPSSEVNYATEIIHNLQGDIELQLEQNGIYPVPGGIVYCKHPKDSYSEMEFYWYDRKTKKTKKIGSVSNWAHNTTGPIYQDGHLYLFVLNGDLSSEKHWLKLMDFDTRHGTMQEIFSEKDGYPYNTMSYNKDRLLLTKVRTGGSSYLEEYQIKTGKRRTLLEANFDSGNQTGERFLHAVINGDTLCLLVQKSSKNESEKLRIDLYDSKMHFLRSIDISRLFEDENQIGQPVAWFISAKNTVYYENYSTEKFLGRLRDDTVKKIMNISVETNGEFTMAVETERDQNFGIFINRFSKEHDLYKVDYATGSIQRAEYHPKEEGKILTFAWRIGDTLLLEVQDEDASGSNKFVYDLFEVPLSQLDFKPYK